MSAHVRLGNGSLQQKPIYIHAFDWIGGLPSKMSAHTVGLLIWVWRYTNSQEGHEGYGKAWASHVNLAKAMHVSPKTIQRAFNDAWAWGVISREHLFKKNGKVVVSTAPLTKSNRGLGEFQHTRYWLNWDFMRELRTNGVVTESTPIDGDTESTPNPIGLVRESTALVRESREVSKEGFIFTPQYNETDDSADRQGVPKESAGDVVVGDDNFIFSESSPSSFPKAPLRVGNESAADSNAVAQEYRTEQAIADARRRQIERKMSEVEIIREYERVFEHVRSEASKRWSDRKPRREIALSSEAPLKTNVARHRQEAADLYRNLGGAETMSAWEDFLANGDLTTTEVGEGVVQRTWLLHDFVVNMGDSIEAMQASRRRDLRILVGICGCRVPK